MKTLIIPFAAFLFGFYFFKNWKSKNDPVEAVSNYKLSREHMAINAALIAMPLNSERKESPQLYVNLNPMNGSRRIPKASRIGAKIGFNAG